MTATDQTAIQQDILDWLYTPCRHPGPHMVRGDCARCFADTVRELFTIRGERDSLQLRVQRLGADEDRLDWLDEMADYNTFDTLLRLLDKCDGVRAAIDALRGAKP